MKQSERAGWEKSVRQFLSGLGTGLTGVSAKQTGRAGKKVSPRNDSLDKKGSFAEKRKKRRRGYSLFFFSYSSQNNTRNTFNQNRARVCARV
jgi:hypothetical protein